MSDTPKCPWHVLQCQITDGSLYSNWKWPDVEGLTAFDGDLIHTANWPKDFDAAGKVVAVIGNGSTGIQVVPELQKSEHFLCYFTKNAQLTV